MTGLDFLVDRFYGVRFPGVCFYLLLFLSKEMFFLAILAQTPSVFLMDLVATLAGTQQQHMVIWPGQDLPNKPFSHVLILPSRVQICLREGLALLALKSYDCVVADGCPWVPSADLVATVASRYGLGADPASHRPLDLRGPGGQVQELVQVSAVKNPVVLMSAAASGRSATPLEAWVARGGQVYMVDPRPPLGLFSPSPDIATGHQVLVWD